MADLRVWSAIEIDGSFIVRASALRSGFRNRLQRRLLIFVMFCDDSRNFIILWERILLLCRNRTGDLCAETYACPKPWCLRDIRFLFAVDFAFLLMFGTLLNYKEWVIIIKKENSLKSILWCSTIICQCVAISREVHLNSAWLFCSLIRTWHTLVCWIDLNSLLTIFHQTPSTKLCFIPFSRSAAEKWSIWARFCISSKLLPGKMWVICSIGTGSRRMEISMLRRDTSAWGTPAPRLMMLFKVMCSVCWYFPSIMCILPSRTAKDELRYITLSQFRTRIAALQQGLQPSLNNSILWEDAIRQQRWLHVGT